MFSYFRRSMIARLIAVGAVAMITSGSQVSCNSGGDVDDLPPFERPREINSGNGTTFSTTLVLRDAAGTEKYRFSPGEQITLQLTVRNRTAAPVEVQLSSPLTADFFVFTTTGTTPLWSCAFDRAFPTVVVPLSFAANETKVMSCIWHQEVPNGTALPNGVYEARGAVMVVGVFAPDGSALTPHELASGLEAFRIE